MGHHHKRRSQADRRTETRAAILDATVACLAERGYHRTSTSAISRRAGVSVGALQHHFESKTDLLTASIEHVLHMRLDEFAKAMSSRDPEADDFDAAIDTLWLLMSGPTFVAWLELALAARTDRDLGPALAETDARFAEAAAAQFSEWFGHVPGLDTTESRDRVLDVVFAALRGVALDRLGYADGDQSDPDGPTPEPEQPPTVQMLKDLSRIVFPRSTSAASTHGETQTT